MLGFGWLTLRQAQEALDNGRLEEAYRLLCQPDVQGHKGASPLIRQVAQGFLRRSEEHLAHKNIAAAWSDLQLAEKLGGSDSAAVAVRQRLIKVGLAEGQKLLEAGEPGRALEAIKHLHEETVPQADVQLMEEVTRGWIFARDLAGRGEFALAQETVDRIRALLLRPPAALERFRQDLKERRPAFGVLLVKLHQAVNEKRWQDVIALSDQALALAPQHGEARKARGRAWKAVEPAPKASPKVMEEAVPSGRFLLWVDGVGGFLVCLGSRITIGQAAPDAFVDVPLFADISRTHAAITRDADGYLLEAVRPLQVNGQPAEKSLLQPGDRVTLGHGCQFQFRQPVPVSASARLDFVSGHRLPVTVNGVLMMADTLVLGSGSQVHVLVPDMQKPVVLYRTKDALGLRGVGTLIVDGQTMEDRAMLGPTSYVRGDDFALAVEPVGARMGRS